LRVLPLFILILTHTTKYMCLPLSGINNQLVEAGWPKLEKGAWGVYFYIVITIQYKWNRNLNLNLNPKQADPKELQSI
jgi:hypothetical protein